MNEDKGKLLIYLKTRTWLTKRLRRESGYTLKFEKVLGNRVNACELHLGLTQPQLRTERAEEPKRRAVGAGGGF